MIPKASKTGAVPRRIIFITGTDTGVGKTLFSGLLLAHLRSSGCQALAVKPFCSGGMGDVEFLGSLQNWELRPDQICPFYFDEPLAPLVAARTGRRRIQLSDVLKRVREISQRCECLIVEGSGGLLVPLGEGYTVADLIRGLNCSVVLVARNRLGTINHTLLSMAGLRAIGVRNPQVIMMNGNENDPSTHSNGRVLRELLAPVSLLEIPFFGPKALQIQGIEKNCRKIKKTLARVTGIGNLSPVHSLRMDRLHRKAC